MRPGASGAAGLYIPVTTHALKDGGPGFTRKPPPPGTLSSPTPTTTQGCDPRGRPVTTSRMTHVLRPLRARPVPQLSLPVPQTPRTRSGGPHLGTVGGDMGTWGHGDMGRGPAPGEGWPRLPAWTGDGVRSTKPAARVTHPQPDTQDRPPALTIGPADSVLPGDGCRRGATATTEGRSGPPQAGREPAEQADWVPCEGDEDRALCPLTPALLSCSALPVALHSSVSCSLPRCHRNRRPVLVPPGNEAKTDRGDSRDSGRRCGRPRSTGSRTQPPAACHWPPPHQPHGRGTQGSPVT